MVYNQQATPNTTLSATGQQYRDNTLVGTTVRPGPPKGAPAYKNGLWHMLAAGPGPSLPAAGGKAHGVAASMHLWRQCINWCTCSSAFATAVAFICARGQPTTEAHRQPWTQRAAHALNQAPLSTGPSNMYVAELLVLLLLYVNGPQPLHADAPVSCCSSHGCSTGHPTPLPQCMLHASPATQAASKRPPMAPL
jgi:hypothetical protein